jgi:hypothetical protein
MDGILSKKAYGFQLLFTKTIMNAARLNLLSYLTKSGVSWLKLTGENWD